MSFRMGMRYFFLFFVAIQLLVSCQWNKKAELIPVENFFKITEKSAYRISPDGKYISYLQPYQNRQNIFVQTIDGKNVTRITSETENNVSFYFWGNNSEILYAKDRIGNAKSYLFAVGRDGKNSRVLVQEEKARIRLLAGGRLYNNEILVGMNKRDSSLFDAYRVNILTGKMKMVAQNPGNIADWYADNEGKIRMAITSDGVTETFLFRQTEESDLKPFLANNFKTTVLVVGFTADNTGVYALSNQNRDKQALVEIDCFTGKERKVIYSNEDVDVSDVEYSPVTRSVRLVTYETTKRQRHYIDEDAREIYEKLEKLLPNTELKITDKDSAEQKYIVRTYTDRNPGSYYLYERAGNTIRKLNDINPNLKEDQMCEMKPISYAASDGLMLNGYLTLPLNSTGRNLPVVVLPHGGPTQRNSWNFNSEVQFLANRGYAVFQVNYRGSYGYGKRFWTAGFKQWGGRIQEDISDGVRWLIKEGIANPERIGIYGSGFGGYSALSGLSNDSKLYACGASYSGVINLFTDLKTIPPYYRPYLMMYYEMVGDPEKDTEYLRKASPVFHTDKINAPVLIAQGAKDPRVSVNETNQFVKDLRKKGVNVTYILKENESHFFRKPENRLEFYSQLEKFLDANLNKK